ncbi:hypothetical protein LXA43DRAFT_889735 [Ganoderma leucocontextum]|nr:hypothetical protein LXA43DRAFT_889735 [Ganoderma leucocontextum]
MLYIPLPPAHAFHAPILKVPFLLANGIASYRALTPPEEPPLAKEREKAESVPGVMLRYPILHRAIRVCARASKYFFCGVSFVEVALILGHHPSWSYSAYIPRSLLPFVRLWSLQLTPMSVAGCVLGIAGGFIRTRCYRELGHLFTWEVAVRDDHKLVTTGPYSIVRHPGYTGYYLLLAGNVMLLASKGSWFTESGLWNTLLGKGVAGAATAFLASVALRLFWRLGEEDQMLKKEFGEEWDEWAKKTPYRLIPFVY